MKLTTVLIASIMTSVANAQSYSQDFSSGQGEFVALDIANTTINTTSGALQFGSAGVNNQLQGAEITVDLDTTNVFGTDFVNVRTNSSGDTESIFFQFTTIVPSDGNELSFFFGPENSGDSNQNGFTIFLQNNGLFAQDNGQGNILSGLQDNSEITLNIEWFLVEAQNPDQFNNVFTVTADGIDTDQNAVSATDTFDGAQNQGVTQINNFQFLGALALISRRKRA